MMNTEQFPASQHFKIRKLSLSKATVIIMNESKEKTCCFTGHREIAKKDLPRIQAQLETELMKLIKNGYRYFGTGGALGFDTIAAQAVLRIREKHPFVRLILILPCLTQAKSWNKADQEMYEEIKSKANKVVYTSEEYFRGCMHKRNRHLVDNSSICICYLKKKTGGTAYTVHYARENNVGVINIADLL